MTREYVDEKVRYIINQVQEEQAWKGQSIYESVNINGRYYEFEGRSFFEERLKIQIPTSFVTMPLELVKLKYPSSDRPQIIETDTNGAIDISFSLIPNHIHDEQIPEVKDGMKRIFQKLNPSYLFFPEGIEMVAGKSIGFFEFKSPTLTEPLFNVMFFIEIDGNVIMGCFNCPYEEYLLWQPIVGQILQSVRVGKKAEEPPAQPACKDAVARARGAGR